ncbi:Rz1-like lysis system protein LysC [Halopseudomonas litoralis]|uniref:Rz1-like lysis system protein LysC n=1 Tax=Halopseudomonas litoralis TaxID=797277 RepID=UPI0038B2D5EC
MNCYATGLLLICLALLSACAPVQPLPAPQIIRLGCPAVTPCILPATSPAQNGDLLTDADRIEAAWAECAAQVDIIYQYQVTHEQARFTPRALDASHP